MAEGSSTEVENGVLEDGTEIGSTSRPDGTLSRTSFCPGPFSRAEHASAPDAVLRSMTKPALGGLISAREFVDLGMTK